LILVLCNVVLWCPSGLLAGGLLLLSRLGDAFIERRPSLMILFFIFHTLDSHTWWARTSKYGDFYTHILSNQLQDFFSANILKYYVFVHMVIQLSHLVGKSILLRRYMRPTKDPQYLDRLSDCRRWWWRFIAIALVIDRFICIYTSVESKYTVHQIKFLLIQYSSFKA
jgi:hypothetical protein